MTWKPEVIVVGAGAAGLAAASRLTQAGVNVHVIEARDRIGGRIWTTGEYGAPIELGAEFIHGQPPATWELLDGAAVDEVRGTDVCLRDGQFAPCDFFEQVGDFLDRMQRDARDQPFSAWLRENGGDVPDEIRRRACMYVEGFNAAHADEISVNALVRAGAAEEKNGERQFRIRGGYSYIPRLLLDRCDPEHLRLRMHAAVQRVEWRKRHVAATGDGFQLEARAAVLTLPLGVLHAGSVEFRPALDEQRSALGKLAVGHVIRVVLRFRERFWERDDLRFLFTDDECFPTWWTSELENTLVGWVPASSAERLAGLPEKELIGRAVQSLAAIFSKPITESLLLSGHVHDWQADPYALGAYSYPRAGGEDAGAELSQPIDDALFFAGEATDTEGNFGTVHGAIASGYRAAEEVLAAE